jgi:predicted phosphodiesterase
MASIESGEEEGTGPVLKAKSVAVMSDIHLGAGNCVLDQQDHLQRLNQFLGDNAVDVDVLILNGDVCDFALATMQQTIASAVRFVNVLKDRFKHIVYVPGNHDHHSWLLANEVHQFLFALPNVNPLAVQRTERMYKSTFLKRISGGPDRDIFIAYPNLYWKPPATTGRTYVFHHGHYCEDLYSIVSDTLSQAFPGVAGTDLEFLEATNFGWLEFIWYQLGQAGKGIGANGLIEKLYEQIRKDGARTLRDGIDRVYKARLSPILHALAKKQADKRWYVTSGMAEWAANWVDDHAADAIVAAIGAYAEQKKNNDQTPGASAWRAKPLDAGLAEHCHAYLKRCASSAYIPPTDEVSLFFGHTHVAGVWQTPGKPRLFNDGGWIRGANHEWPDSHVFKIDSGGAVTDLYFGPTPAESRVTTL